MDHLSTSADISGRIGALELSDVLASFDDGPLEASGASMSPGPTRIGACTLSMCPPPTIHGVTCISDGELESAAIGLNPTQPVTNPIRFCMRTYVCISDGELESAAGMGLNPHPGTNTPACLQTLRLPGGVAGCVGDDALEAAGSRLAGMATTPPFDCTMSPRHSCASDAALEAAAGASMNPPITSPLNIACAHTRVSDADLEAGMSMAPQVTQNIVCLPRFISDAALEASMGPQVTMNLVCMPRHIEDGALEAVGPATGPKPTSRAMGCPFIVPEISDATLEASMSPTPATYPMYETQYCCPPSMCISDADLEAGMSMALQVTQNIVCLPRFIDDGALEAAGPATGPKPTSRAMGCPFIVPEISDAALEAAALAFGPHSQPNACTMLRGACASDAQLEAAAADLHPGPTIAATGCLPRTQLGFGCP